MGKPEDTVRAVMGTFHERQRQLRVTFREAGVVLPPKVKANMARVLERVREIAIFNVETRPGIDPETIIEAIDAADREHRALTRLKGKP